MNKQVTRITKDNYYINFNNEFAYTLRGVLYLKKEEPIVGDFVQIDEKTIIKILPRQNQMIRPHVSNVDQVGIVVSTLQPRFDSHLLNKMLLYVESMEIEPLIILTKIDLLNANEFKNDYIKNGYRVLDVSNKTGENLFLLKNALENKLTVLMGKSGSGKSSTINKLLNLNLKVQQVSKGINSGRHTTRIVEIYNYQNIKIIDTPGFSKFNLKELGISLENIRFAYKEFRKNFNKCSFNNCLHTIEKDCEIKRLVNKQMISRSMYLDYVETIGELKNVKK